MFDYASVHIITTATLQRLKEASPKGQLTIQRFRPNIVVDCANETGFVENSWPGRTLPLGAGLVLRGSFTCPRCVMTTLPRTDLPHDPRILRTLADQNRLDLGDFGHLPCAGVYVGFSRSTEPVVLGCLDSTQQEAGAWHYPGTRWRTPEACFAITPSQDSGAAISSSSA